MQAPDSIPPSRLPIFRVEDVVFTEPQKAITSPLDVNTWLASEGFNRIMTFLTELNESVKGVTNDSPCPESPFVEKVISLLNTIDGYIDNIPVDEKILSRYGHPAFRTFIARVQEQTPTLLAALLPDPAYVPSFVELGPYLTGSFGNETRIDYGSGHELSFFAWLLCLQLLGRFQPTDRVALVVRILDRYLELVRRLQLTYRLEPAGSHGVWGLDDYQFLPFILGSAQFLGSPYPDPSIIANVNLAKKLSAKYMLMRCIEFITQVKVGPFFEHSPILNDISGVPYWKKVNQGLQKMYVGDVLSKFPVVQHLPFGTLIPIKPREN
ncbi:Serine/threonine-protein phosphatase 2A activator 1 [Tieghemiomyces parasiticus]|uniref:Serine/threonine-protein phosphatase 2A activator n=1 Tax=Tieghemiomyces parasiticus TaxID=78921 RepID=A0A9W8AFD1_9FUNG|nr:Serine/threonine-protein phosphatase 2A activator 1 [Tieghemiomyces parasiticus]